MFGASFFLPVPFGFTGWMFFPPRILLVLFLRGWFILVFIISIFQVKEILMATLLGIKGLLEERRFAEAIGLVVEDVERLKRENSLRAFREWVDQPEEELKGLLRVLDMALMERLSHVVARFAYRREQTPQTTLWYCDELIDRGRLLEAEVLLKELEERDDSTVQENHVLTDAMKEKLYFKHATVLILMQRFGAAFRYMEMCEKVAKEPMGTRWGYYYLKKGEWEKALEYLKNSLNDEYDGVYAHLLLVQQLSLQGELGQAKKYLEEALGRYPDYPALLIEKIRIEYKLKSWQEMRETISTLDRLIPHHEYKSMGEFFIAESFYEENEPGKLAAHLEEHPVLLKKSHFRHFSGAKEKPAKLLKYKLAAQKYNYCAPASMEMIFSMFHTEIGQDSIAEEVFEGNGTKLTKAIDYFESKGFKAILFRGSVERFKTLVDQGAAVMISIHYPVNSHVQLLAGYDDNLQVFHIQDPNFRETHTVEYADFAKEFGNNEALSIAVVPEAEAEKLAFLDGNDHNIALRLLNLTENVHTSFSEDDKQFVKEQIGSFLGAVFAVKFFAESIDKEWLEEAAAVVERSLEDEEYKHLIMAFAFARMAKYEDAERHLEKMKPWGYRSAKWYIKGRLHNSRKEYEKAANAFWKGIEAEPDDYVMWSYLAISLSNLGQHGEALRLSEIALDINGEDVFPRANHGLILLNQENYQEARAWFHRLLRDDKENAFLWYQRARSDEQLGRNHQALRGYKIASALAPDNPHAYRELANLYEFAFEDKEKALTALQKGIELAGEEAFLYEELGGLYERDGRNADARKLHEQACEIDPTNPSPRLAIGRVLKDEKEFEAFFAYMEEGIAVFEEDPEYLINGGRMIWEAAGELESGEEKQEKALDWFEKGLTLAYRNLKNAVDLYVELISGTPFQRRGIDFLASAAGESAEPQWFHWYEGYLCEQEGLFDLAKEKLHLGLTFAEDILPYYRLGEIAYKEEDFEAAEEYYLKVVALDPFHEQAFLDLAAVAGRTGNVEKELDFLLRVFRLNPYRVGIEMIADLMDRVRLVIFLQEIKELEGKCEEAFILYASAAVYWKLGHIDEEEKCLKEALQIAPDSVKLRTYLVSFHLRQGNARAARKLVLELIAENVEDRELYDLYVEAAERMRSVSRMKNELIGLKLEKHEKSLACMHAAAAVERANSGFSEECANVFGGGGIIKRVVQWAKLTIYLAKVSGLYEAAIKLDPENTQAAIWYAELYQEFQVSDEAIKVCQKALKRTWNTDIAYKLAYLYVNDEVVQGEGSSVSFGKRNELRRARYLEEAKSLMERSLEEEEYPGPLGILGYVLYEQGHHQEAKDVFERLLEINPEADNAYYFLAIINTIWGNCQKAERLIQEAIRLEPNDSDYKQQLRVIRKKMNQGTGGGAALTR